MWWKKPVLINVGKRTQHCLSIWRFHNLIKYYATINAELKKNLRHFFSTSLVVLFWQSLKTALISVEISYNVIHYICLCKPYIKPFSLASFLSHILIAQLLPQKTVRYLRTSIHLKFYKANKIRPVGVTCVRYQIV